MVHKNEGGLDGESLGNEVFSNAFDESEVRAVEEEKRGKQTLTQKAQRAFEKASDNLSEQMRGILHYSSQLEKVAKNLDDHVKDARAALFHFIQKSKRNRLGGKQFSYKIPIRGPRIIAMPGLGDPFKPAYKLDKSADVFEIAGRMRGITVEDIETTHGFRALLAAVEGWNKISHQDFIASQDTKNPQKDDIELLAEIDGASRSRGGQFDFDVEFHFKPRLKHEEERH